MSLESIIIKVKQQEYNNDSSNITSPFNLTKAKNIIFDSKGRLFSLFLTLEGLFAYINYNPLQPYFSYRPYNYNLKLSYFQLLNQGLAFFVVDILPEPYAELLFPLALSSQYLRIGSGRHLRLYDRDWVEVGDILTQSIHYCGYPTVCSSYGVCTNEQSSCPQP